MSGTTTGTSSRKAEHVGLSVKGPVGHREKRTGFDDLDFEHNALPELAFAEIDTRTTLLGHDLGAPLMISSMTGGYAGAVELNRSLASAAERYGLAIGVGSERQALESSSHHRSFSIVREAAPTAFIFGNIGGVEVARLHHERRIHELRTLTDLIGANALAIHLNPLQELLQPEGAHDYRGVLDGIRECVESIGIPVIVKEVGAGISATVAERLLSAGVSAIDVAGAGGTSWAGIEILRNGAEQQASLEPLWDWGIPTVEALTRVRELRRMYQFDLISSGGIRNGVDIAKSIALGASASGIARPLITALVNDGEEGLDRVIRETLFQLRAVMYLTGSATIASLSTQRLTHRQH